MNRSSHTRRPIGVEAETAMELTRRYNLMTTTALTSLRFELFRDHGEAGRTLYELESCGQLIRAELYRNQSYFYPATERSTLSEMAKIRRYAMLAVCASQKGQRTRVTKDDFVKYFPGLARAGRPMNYYIDLSGDEPLLGFLRIDGGGHARWDRIVAKAMDDARKHRLDPAFRPFVDRAAIEIRIVTSLPQKADRIARTLREKSTRLPIHVTAIPELTNLVAPLPAV